MLTTIGRRYHFESAHWLPNVPPGHKCRRNHGHNYEIEITINGFIDNHTGWIEDFFNIDALVLPIIGRLDHRVLNEVEGLQNPTAENITHWIYTQLMIVLDTTDLRVTHLKLFETKDCWVELYLP